MKKGKLRSRVGPYAPYIAAALLIAVVYAVYDWVGDEEPTTYPLTELSRSAVDVPGHITIADAYASGRSGMVVEAAGRVARILPDDETGDRHQRFILRLPSGQTLLVSHNIDVAPRVPIAVGDSVEFRGEYEWNEQGGVIHWTHHDPGGNRPGGWLRHQGRVYR